MCGQFDRSHCDGRTSVLLEAGTALLARVASDWGCDDTVLRNFLVQIDGLYERQPYHNAKHGTLVRFKPVVHLLHSFDFSMARCYKRPLIHVPSTIRRFAPRGGALVR